MISSNATIAAFDSSIDYVESLLDFLRSSKSPLRTILLNHLYAILESRAADAQAQRLLIERPLHEVKLANGSVERLQALQKVVAGYTEASTTSLELALAFMTFLNEESILAFRDPKLVSSSQSS